MDFRSNGPDRTVVQIPVTIEGGEATRRLTADLEETWGGHGTEITVTGGGALVASGLTTALGILVLVFAPLTPIRELGLMVAITILLVLIATFVVLPPLLVLWSLYHRWRTETELMTRLDALEAMEAQRGPDWEAAE